MYRRRRTAKYGARSLPECPARHAAVQPHVRPATHHLDDPADPQAADLRGRAALAPPGTYEHAEFLEPYEPLGFAVTVQLAGTETAGVRAIHKDR